MTVEDIITENERNALATHKLASENKRVRETNRLVLNDVAELDPPRRPIAEEPLIERQMLGRRDQQDVANTGQHQDRERIVDHWLVIDGQELLVYGKRCRVEPGPGTAGKN